jgi:hypothetical protein
MDKKTLNDGFLTTFGKFMSGSDRFYIAVDLTKVTEEEYCDLQLLLQDILSIMPNNCRYGETTKFYLTPGKSYFLFTYTEVSEPQEYYDVRHTQFVLSS